MYLHEILQTPTKNVVKQMILFK